MTSQFSPKVSEILAFSREEAARLSSTSVTPEHLLLGMMRQNDGPVSDVFKRLNINKEDIKFSLEMNVQQSEGFIHPENPNNLELNDNASNILKLAVLEARLQHVESVDLQHVLLAILHDRGNNGARKVLEEHNMNYDNVQDILKPKDVQNPTQTPQASQPAPTPQPQDALMLPEDDEEESLYKKNERTSNTTTDKPKEKSKTPVLDNFSTDLTKAALDGKLDPCVGREQEIQRVMEILGRRKKNNPILIGEPGVGKSAIVEGLAQLIAQRKCSPMFFNKRIVSLDMTGVVAGTKYRGQFEERIRALLKEIEQNPNIIVFIDEIHTIIGAGSTPGSMDAANIMKPALARGTIQCIGDVTFTDDAIRACVTLTERYITDRAQPDKAIDAMDETGARVHLKNAQIPPEIEAIEKQLDEVRNKKHEAVVNQNYELAASYRDNQVQLEQQLAEVQRTWTEDNNEKRQTVTEAEVSDVVSMMTGIPVQRMAENEGVRLKNMAPTLKSCVIAQDNAIDKMVKAIQRNRVGLKAPNHPIGAFMFLGPTGVGKTYLAKKLAEQMFGSADALIRVDMSEYTESFNVSRLIGAPPGYVGYEEGGQLTERVRRKPYSIVLLDEIEKAHGNVFNLLLQVLDEGRLTDGNGRFVDFRNTVIIMTSNAGTRQLKEFGNGIGFTASTFGLNMNEKDREHARSIVQKALSKQFSPEFLNRLDEIITFDQLDLDAIKRIIDVELKSVFKRIGDMGYQIQLSDAAKEFVATKGYDVQFGARPLKRAIQNYIEDGICELILADTISQGDTIAIDKHPEKEELKFEVLKNKVSRKETK